MIRSRLTSVALALGFGLLTGCTCLSQHPWFNRNRNRPVEDCACVPVIEQPIATDGPIIGNGMGCPAPAPSPGMVLTAPPTLPQSAPPSTLPSSPPQRLVPQPLAPAPTSPYVPR